MRIQPADTTAPQPAVPDHLENLRIRGRKDGGQFIQKCEGLPSVFEISACQFADYERMSYNATIF